MQAPLVPARRVPGGHLQQGAGRHQGRGAGQRARPQLQRGLLRLEGAGEGAAEGGGWGGGGSVSDGRQNEVLHSAAAAVKLTLGILQVATSQIYL